MKAALLGVGMIPLFFVLFSTFLDTPGGADSSNVEAELLSAAAPGVDLEACEARIGR